jgi:hypothetical protein
MAGTGSRDHPRGGWTPAREGRRGCPGICAGSIWQPTISLSSNAADFKFSTHPGAIGHQRHSSNTINDLRVAEANPNCRFDPMATDGSG